MKTTAFRFRHMLRAALLLACASAAGDAHARTIKRAEVLEIARSYVEHRWTATARNVRHGRDGSGIEIRTPDRESGRGQPAEDCWLIGQENTGVPYKWGGYDTPASFSAGVRAGRAAGDIYTPEKRRLGGAAVSGDAVGIDCSGFVSRCWRLAQRQSTATLATVCRPLRSAAELRSGDVMNTAHGHVLLFVKWLDASQRRALFYEAAPFGKTRATERDVPELVAGGYQPLRYRQIAD